ncbi:hypothetical protein EJB05_40374, partial [Eragrostis curvula]
MKDLTPSHKGSRWRGGDEDMTRTDTTNTHPLDMKDLITRGRARLATLLVSSFLMPSLYGFENILIPNELIIVSNHGDDEEAAGEVLGGVEGRQEVQIKFEAQSKSVSSPFRTPGPVGTKTGAQVAYEIGFGRYLYGWKAKKITFPMEPVSCLNSPGVIGNHRNKLTSRICPGAAPPLFGLWACISCEPIRGRVQGSLHDPRVFINSRCHTIRVWVLIDCDTEILEPSMLHLNIQDIIQHFPSYNGESFNARAYIDWELKVENIFDEHDLTEKEKIYIASNVLNENALDEWKHICRRKKVPQSWQDFKLHFRYAFISEYHVDKLLARLDHLKQGNRTVKEYYHEFKICIIFGGLDGSQEDVMNRFMRGLNSEIRTMLISQNYNHIAQLFLLAKIAENHIATKLSETATSGLLPVFDTKKSLDVTPPIPCTIIANIGQEDGESVAPSSTPNSGQGNFSSAEFAAANEEVLAQTLPHNVSHHDVLNLSTPHASLEQPFVDSITEFPLLQHDYIVACDKEELCDHASLISTTQLVHECASLISVGKDTHAEPKSFHCIESEKEELKIISSLNCLGTMEMMKRQLERYLEAWRAGKKCK